MVAYEVEILCTGIRHIFGCWPHERLDSRLFEVKTLHHAAIYRKGLWKMLQLWYLKGQMVTADWKTLAWWMLGARLYPGS